MTIYDYTTSGGNNKIEEYLDKLPKGEKERWYYIRQRIRVYGNEAFRQLDTRQLKGKLWEIKLYNNRIMYVVADKENVYFLHACKKQKNQTEQKDLNKAIRRAKEQNLL